MKRIIIIINLFVLNLVISYGQNSCLTDNTNSPCCNSLISTDPRNNNASNLERPEYKNYFNWMTNKIWVYHPDGDYDNGVGNPIQIDNPFYTDDSYLRNINFKTFDLGYYDASKLDFYPEDGWELLHRNNGYQMNNQSILVNPSSAEDRAGPYFILYNKYTATIRLLGSFKGFGANDKMITTMSFRLQNSNVKPSALLSENGIVAQTLEETTKVLNVSQGSQGAAATEGNGWFVTDFKMGYDPCGCMNNSELNFKFSTNDDAKVTLGGRLIATSVPLGTDGTVPLINGNDYLLSVYKDGFDVKGGMLTYNNIDKLVSNYKSTYNLTDLEQTGINLLGDVLKAGLSGGIDPILNGAVSKFATNLIGAETLKELTGEDKLKIGLGVGAQSSKFLMAAITPQKPKVPNIHFIEGEMVLSGTITNSTDLGIGDINIATPGSPNTLDANLPWYNYPFYNEPLGLIAFLEKPNLDYYSEYSKEPVHTSNCYQGYCWPVDIPGISTYYIRISNPIKFALNPAAEINVSKTRIYAGYIAEIKWIDNYGTGKETSRDKFHSGFYPISNLDDILIPIDVEARWGTINSLTDLKIKFIIEYEFDRNKYGKINKSINILTYNVNYKQVEKSSLSSFINARNFPEPYKVINDVTYAQNTTITALDKIIIKGNVKTTSDDVKVTFVAGNEVVVNNPSVLKPNITIKTGNINGFTFDYSINPQSIQDVKTFCQSTQYKANTTTSSSLKSARLVVDENKTNDLKVNINDSKFDNTTFTIYPNPTKDKLNIQILNQEEKNIKIKLLSTVGYSVFSQELNHISNENLIQIDLSNCSKGIYLLLIQSGTKQINKKIIVQ